MSIKVDQPTAVFATAPAPSVQSSQTVDDENLWTDTEDETVDETSDNEAKIAALKEEKNKLQEERNRLDAERRDYSRQKASLEKRRDNLKAIIDANTAKIEEWKATVKANEAELEAEKAEVERLRAEYKEKTALAAQLDENLKAKIQEVLEKSNQEIKDLNDRVDAARKEAEDLVASGDLTEDEVAQYIMDKVGGGQVQSSSADLSIINSLCSQLKNTITDAANILPNLAVHETKMHECQANIEAGSVAIDDLSAKNVSLNGELNTVNGNISLLSSEISSLDGQINDIDGQIADIDLEISSLQSNSGATGPQTVNGDVVLPLQTRGVGNVGAPDSPVDDVSGDDEPYVPPTYVNPFASVKFETVSYTNEVNALTASADSVDTLLTTVREQLQKNNEEYQNIFERLGA